MTGPCDPTRRRVLGWGLGAAAFVATGGVGWARQGDVHLPRPVERHPRDLRLTAAVASRRTRAWLLNDSLPGPTLRARTGERFEVELVNHLPEDTVLHWHGLDVPEDADGHPRLAIGPGGSRQYTFDVVDRAGTYWYHPHPDGRTGFQTYRGLSGFLLVGDDEESALGLPDGGYELPLLLQDKKVDERGDPLYSVFGPEQMTGFLGDRPFANGVERPTVEVERTRYRLRLLNGCNARILRLALPGVPLTVIGTDGGLLDRAVSVERAWLGSGERLDLLVDFSSAMPGDRLTLRSEAFRIPGMMMPGPPPGRGPRRGRGMHRHHGAGRQGTAMDFVDFVVTDSPSRPGPPLPGRLSSLEPVTLGDVPLREFRFESAMHHHSINGRRFELDRVDTRVALGQTERWRFINDSPLPHPVHVHAGQFRVLTRLGGRGRLEPWETGLKDTVLVFPDEEVDVAVRFANYRGLFLLHCHNLEHEDAGMMANFEVI